MNPLQKIRYFIKTRRALSVFVFLFLFVAVMYIAFGKPSKVDVNRANMALSNANGDPTADSDGDGLLNWQEAVYGTDPFSRDTDGDGFEDLNEIENGYDPKLKGDGKGSDKIKKVNNIASEEVPAPPLTENLTAGLVAGLMDKKTADITENDFSQENVIKSLASSLNSQDTLNKAAGNSFEETAKQSAKAVELFLNPPLPKEPERNLTDSPGTRQEYVSSLLNTIKRDIPKMEESVANIIQNYLATGNAEQIDALITNYKTAVDDLSNIMPPESFYDFHIKELKNLQSTYLLAFTIRHHESDALKASLYMSLLKFVVQLSVALTKDFNNLLDLYKITPATL